MLTEENVKTAQALIDGLNAHDLKGWAASLAEDFVGEYPGARGLKQEQAAMYNQAFVVAFPDLRFDVHRIIANGDTVVIHWTGSGTMTGPLATLSGQTIPPTGKIGKISGVFLVQVKDGRITKEQTYWDQMELLAQLGLAPA
jgi:steroid delta-isomerase-like uncharacterized protein